MEINEHIRKLFLSTPSARRATGVFMPKFMDLTDFYPRPPRGGRLFSFLRWISGRIFLSTPSARRATYSGSAMILPFVISIHALREEGDARTRPFRYALLYFYPRPPRGGRPLRPSLPAFALYFYPRPPRGGRPVRPMCSWQPANFYPRPPRGGRLRLRRGHPGHGRISIHALREEGDCSHGGG